MQNKNVFVILSKCCRFDKKKQLVHIFISRNISKFIKRTDIFFTIYEITFNNNGCSEDIF